MMDYQTIILTEPPKVGQELWLENTVYPCSIIHVDQNVIVCHWEFKSYQSQRTLLFLVKEK